MPQAMALARITRGGSDLKCGTGGGRVRAPQSTHEWSCFSSVEGFVARRRDPDDGRNGG